MRRSLRLNPTFIGLVLVLVTTSCALFSVPNDVGLKKLGVDLTFGGKLPTQPPTPTGFSLPPVPTLTQPEPPEPEPEPPPPPPLCGATTAIAPRDRAVTSMHADPNGDGDTEDGQIPLEGNYPFRFVGNMEGGAPFQFDTNKVISNAQQTGTPGGFEYDISDPFLPGIRLGFESRPIADTDPSGADAGLYLTKIEIPRREEGSFFGGELLLFEPQPALKLVGFPIQPGSTITRSSPDVAPKNEAPVSDPLTGAPVVVPSFNEMRSNLTIDAAERIIVCEELAQGFRAAWDLQISGEFNLRILGNFWLATQYGGWPVKDDFVVVGDLIPGNYSSNLLKLDPGDYI